MKELISALIKVQQEISSVSKDSVNPFFKSRYTTLAHLAEKLYPVLSKHGFAISQAINGDFLETRLMHTSGQELVSKAPLLYKEGDMQKLGAAISYMRRYSLMAIVGITSDDDDDAQSLAKPQVKPSGFSNQPTQSTVKIPLGQTSNEIKGTANPGNPILHGNATKLPNKAPQTAKEANDWVKQYEKPR